MVYEDDILVQPASIVGRLVIPASSKAIVVFVHGCGSNRFSLRNIYASRLFNKRGYATVLIDLLTEDEKQKDRESKHLRFDINLLTNRVVSIVEWISANHLTRDLLIGIFSASTGTAAALNSISSSKQIKAIVSRGGRLDSCPPSIIRQIKSPLLLIVGSKVSTVVNMSKRIIKEIPNSAIVNFCLIPRASHFFEEPGKMDIVIKFSLLWFDIYLCIQTQVWLTV